MYLRLGRGREPQYNVLDYAILGKARLFSEGEDVAIISTGEVAYEVVKALGILSHKKIHPIAYQFHTIKPLDTETLETLSQKAKTIVVVEEHVASGGLGSAVKDWFCQYSDRQVKVKTLSIADEFVLGSPSQSEIRQRYGIDAQSIVSFIEKEIYRR